jgi:hypothetical protein
MAFSPLNRFCRYLNSAGAGLQGVFSVDRAAKTGYDVNVSVPGKGDDRNEITR